MSYEAAPSRRWFAVLNPVSGRGRALRDRAHVESALRAHDLDVRIEMSRYAGHALPLLAQALDAGERNILAIGGDGTMHEAANAILQHPAASQVTLAPMPVGTGNDWCRFLGVSSDCAALAARCARGKTARFDIGVAAFSSSVPRRYFVNVAGAGFDAYVIERMRDRRFGALAYLVAVMRGLVGFRPQVMRLQADALSHEGRAFVTFVCVGAYCGGGMKVAPTADAHDGMFDVVQVGDLGRLDVLASLRRLFDGTIAAHPKVRTLRAASLTLDAPEALAVEADGELIGKTPVTLSVLPGALRVLVD
ncbi:MAG TPA: diacylglycerol kinase family protein [Burkholderiaceae bacterium]|nr:diacylglycerol kinase family protein [Burkholderiaceae bacterium]